MDAELPLRLEAGHAVGALRIVGALGEGATSQVYLVSDTRAGGELRALKLLSVVGRNHRMRLEAESDAISRTRHPNVVSVHGMVADEGMTGILMEFVAGPTVRRWLQTAEAPVEECIAVAIGVLRGLQAIHENQLVHRDIKPGNIILATEQGDAVVPRLLDFGLVKHIDQGRNLTLTGTSMGTPAYMAPEQLRDASRVDHRADLYSLGCVLFEMLAGVRPFVRDDWWEAYRHVEEGSQVDMHLLPEETPPHVRTVVASLLAPDPEDRPASAAEVIEALVTPYPPESGIHTGSLLYGDRGARIARGLALVQRDALRPQDLDDGILAEASSSVGSDTSTDYTTVLPPDRSRSKLALVVSAMVLVLLLAGAGAAFATGQIGFGPAVTRNPPTPPPAAPEQDATEMPATPVDTVPPAEQPPSPSEPAPPTEAPPAETSRAEPVPEPVETTRAVETSQPEVTPTPVVEPKTPRREPATEPAPREAFATVTVRGDAEAVRLSSAAGESVDVNAQIPAGEYTIEVRWQPGEAYVPGGQLRLAPGQTTTITCQRAFFQCRG